MSKFSKIIDGQHGLDGYFLKDGNDNLFELVRLGTKYAVFKTAPNDVPYAYNSGQFAFQLPEFLTLNAAKKVVIKLQEIV